MLEWLVLRSVASSDFSILYFQYAAMLRLPDLTKEQKMERVSVSKKVSDS